MATDETVETESNEPEFPKPRRGRPRKIDSDLRAVQEQAKAAGILKDTDADVNVDEEDDEDDEDEDGEEEESEDEGEAAAAAPRRRRPVGFGSQPDTAMRTSSGAPPASSAEEMGIVRLLDEWINKLRNDPQAYVLAWRTRPEFVDGKPGAGPSGRWSIDSIKSADDLLNEIEQESGGYVYIIKFTGYDPKTGKVRTLKSFGNVPINAPPILRGTGKGKQNGHGSVLSPDAEIMQKNMEFAHKLLEDNLKNGGPQGREMSEIIKMVKEVADSKNDMLLRELESMRTAQGNPSSETLSKMQTEARREMDHARERWEQDRVRDRERWEEERKTLLREHKEQVERLVDKLESVQDKLKDQQESFSKERLDRDRGSDERQKHREEMHQRDLQSLRDQRDSDVKRLSDQLSDERRSTERLKEAYDIAKGTELSKQEGIFREQIKGQENRIQLLEERIRDLEKQKEALQTDLVNARISKPDPFSTVKDTLGAVSSIAGAIGWKPSGSGDEKPSEMRTEFGQLAKDMKDAGVVDAAKGVLERVGTAFAQRQQPQQQQQQQQPMMPMSPMGIPGAFPIQVSPYPMYQQQQQQYVPQPQQYVPQPQPQPQPQQQPQPQPQQAAPTAPAPAPVAAAPEPAAQQPPLSEAEIEGLKGVVLLLEQASNEGVAVADVAKQIVEQVPRLYLEDIVNLGVDGFQTNIVKRVIALRPEDPDSVLLSPRGETWLAGLLFELRNQMEAAK